MQVEITSQTINHPPNKNSNNIDGNKSAVNLVLAYISDLHLDFKLLDNNLSINRQNETRNYFCEIIKKMYRSIPLESNLDRKIVFLGDISYNFEVFRLFFEVYRELIFDDTFLILGNHELWMDKTSNKSLDQIIETYRAFLARLSPSIVLLENQLWFPNETNHIIGESEILSLDNSKVDDLFSRNDYAIFGGIGYAGKNQNFNQLNHIYQNAPISREEEISRSKRIEFLHTKLKKFGHNQLIFWATHMPMSDWSSDHYVPKWIYLHGHTHKNFCCEQSDKKIFANNQIGYSTHPFSLKYIINRKMINLEVFQDGIHEISCREYISINAKLNIHVNFNREYEKIYMIKREGLYMFFAILPNSRSLKILCGGQIRKATHNLQYYFDNIVKYAQNVKSLMSPYISRLQQISNEVKALGGSGFVHGSIIDIDFYNHIFLNPNDGTITPYFANSMVEKYVYPNVSLLLEQKCPQMLLKAINTDSTSSIFQYQPSIFTNSSSPVLVEDTRMYSLSLTVKNLCYLTNNNVIRLWNDKILLNSNVFLPYKNKSIINRPSDKNTTLCPITPKSSIKTKPDRTKIIKTIKKSSRLIKYSDELLKCNPNVNIESYDTSSRQLTYKCLLCKYIWKATPCKITELHNVKCPKCRKRVLKK